MRYLTILAIALAITACNENSFTTEGGTTVTYINNGTGALPVDSLINLYYITFSTESGQVLQEADVDNPIPLKLDENSNQNSELYKILALLKSGDSVSFEILAKDLFANTFRAPLPDSIEAESKIKFAVSYLDQISEQDYFDMMTERQKKQDEEQLALDAEVIEKYLTENKITALSTESGLRYQITEEGKGEKPTNGQLVNVHYAGKLLDGTYFDTSIESIAKENGLFQEGRQYQPLPFQLGQGRVIKGWDEGVSLLNVGSKATFFIPSPLAYGSRGAGAQIKPNSILIFDVELVSIGE